MQPADSDEERIPLLQASTTELDRLIEKIQTQFPELTKSLNTETLPTSPKDQLNLSRFLILAGLSLGYFFMLLGTIGEGAFEKFSKDQIEQFWDGKAATSINDVPTDSFLKHIHLDYAGVHTLTQILTWILIIGDSFTNFVTIHPKKDFDGAIAALKSHAPLTPEQIEQIKSHRQHASWLRRFFGVLFFDVLPLPMSLIHFVGGASSNADAVINTFKNSTIQKIFGYSLWLGGIFYYYALYLPSFMTHLRLAQFNFYSPQFSLWRTIKNNPHMTLIIAIESTIIQLTRGAMFVFLTRLAWTDTPTLGINTPQSKFALAAVQVIGALASFFTVGMTRTLNVIRTNLPENPEKFNRFCETQKNAFNDLGFLKGHGVMNKIYEIAKGISWGFLPAWGSSYAVRYLSTNNDQMTEGSATVVATLAGAVTGALFFSAYYASIQQQYRIKAYRLYQQIQESLSQLGIPESISPAPLRTEPSAGSRHSLNINLSLEQEPVEMQSNFPSGGNEPSTTANLPDFSGLKNAKQQLETFQQELLNIQKNKHDSLSLENFSATKKIIQLKLTEVAAKISAMEKLILAFEDLKTHLNIDNSSNPDLIHAAILYRQYAAQYSSGVGRAVKVFAYTVNFLSQAVRQISLIHFCEVLANTWFGTGAEMYNHALVFALTFGLIVFGSNMGAYRKALESRCFSLAHMVPVVADYCAQKTASAWAKTTQCFWNNYSRFQSFCPESSEDRTPLLANA